MDCLMLCNGEMNRIGKYLNFTCTCWCSSFVFKLPTYINLGSIMWSLIFESFDKVESLYLPLLQQVSSQVVIYLGEWLVQIFILICSFPFSLDQGAAKIFCKRSDSKYFKLWWPLVSIKQISYDRTFNWNLINKRKKQTQYNQRHWS